MSGKTRRRRRRRNPTSDEWSETLKIVAIVAGGIVVYEIINQVNQGAQNLVSAAVNAPGQAAANLGSGLYNGIMNLFGLGSNQPGGQYLNSQ